MINVSEATKSAYRGSSTHKVLTISVPNRNITITNDDIKSESMELTEMIESEENLTFKGCNASQFKFAVKDVATDIRGEYIEASIQAGETDVIPLFKGYVDSQSNETYEDVSTEFTCYDVLKSVAERNMQSWVDGLTFPITVKNFRNSLFTTLGIAQETVTLVNDSLSISANVKSFLENPTALKIMRWICELNGRFGQIGRDGKFKYRNLTQITKGTYPSSQTFPSDHTFPSGENASAIVDMSLYSHIEYQPYEVDGVNKVYIYDSEGIVQGQYGNGSNIFAVVENPIAFSVNMSTAARNLYAEIHGKIFIPLINLECVGEPWIECGDSLMMNTRKNIVRTYVLQRTLHGIQALFDSIQSDNDKEIIPTPASEMTMINSNKQKVLNIEADIVQMNTVIATKATISDLTATNARVGNLEADHVSVNDLSATNARVGNLEADHVTTQQLSAVQGDIQTLNTTKLNASTASVTYATITNLDAVSGRVSSLEADHVTTQQLNAVQGDINNLSAIAITTQNLSAQSISAGQITSGTISADRISASTITGKLVGQSITVSNVTADNKVTTPEVNANQILRCPTNFILWGSAVITRTITIAGKESTFLILQD